MRKAVTKICLTACGWTAHANTAGQVTITLQSEQDRVNLRIANTGSRVAEMDAHRVFDRFWRGDASRAPEGSGRRHGLGLALCHKLIALLGGSISVSTISSGTFAISIELTWPVGINVEHGETLDAPGSVPGCVL